MSYYAFDNNGYLGDVASVVGWSDFVAWTEGKTGPLAELADSGWTQSLPELVEALAKGRAGNASADSIRRALLALAKKAEGILIVSDGMGDEEPRPSEKRDLAPILPSGATRGSEMVLPDVLQHFKTFKVRMPFLYLVGGLANSGKSMNDIDILMRGPVCEELRRVIEFRLGRMLPPELSSRMQLHDDSHGGPFTNHIELADLVVEMRPHFEMKQMRDVEKQNDPLLDLPPTKGPRPASVQLHYRGRGVHTDLRFKVDDYLVGWTMFTMRPGSIREEVTTVEEARRLAQDPSLDGTRLLKPLMAPARVQATPKSRQPVEWQNIEGEAFEPGSVGATRFEPGVIVAVDHPKVEWGVQNPQFHEYFLTGGKWFNGLLDFRQLVSEENRGTPEGESFWTAFFAKDLLPSVLKRHAVETRTMPPDGHSALPLSLERTVPRQYRYWEKTGDAAREVRDALVESGWLTSENVQLVDGEFARIEKRLYLASDAEDGDAEAPLPPRNVLSLLGGRQAMLLKDLSWPTDDEIATVPEGVCICVTVDAPSDLSVIVDRLRMLKGEWLVDAPRSLHSHAELSLLGTPYTSTLLPGRLLVSSFQPPFEAHAESVGDAVDIEKQPREADFSLLWQWWKGQQVVRQGPSRQVWHLLLDIPGERGLSGWELQADPLTGEDKVGALRHDHPDKALASFTGAVAPGTSIGGEVMNDTRNTPSQIERVDSGTAEILDDQRTFLKVRFNGQHLRGIYNLVLAAPGSTQWQFTEGSEPGRVIPTEKQEVIRPVRLADGTELEDVQLWDPRNIGPEDDRSNDRARLRPLALFRPMKVAPRGTNEFNKESEVAQFATEAALAGGIYVEPKFNGYRFIAEKDGEGRQLLFTEEAFTRRRAMPNFAEALPGLAAELAKLDGPYILDGEMMAFEGDHPVPRRDLAEYRAGAPIDDSSLRYNIFRAIHLPKEGNLTMDSEEANRPKLEAFLRGEHPRLRVVERKLAKTPEQLAAAIKWARDVPGSEGAMFKLAGTTYSLGGENDAWAKLRLTRPVRAIIYQRDPVEGSPGVWTFMCAVGPIPAAEKDEWANTVEVNGHTYVPIGKTFNSRVDAGVGDSLLVDVTELLLDESGAKKTLTWFLPVVDDKVDAGPMTVEQVTSLLAEGERKRLYDVVMEKRLSLVKTTEEHYVLGIVLEPETVDAQKDIYSAEEVRQAAFKFMEEYRQMGLMHRARIADDRVVILESYIAPTDFDMNGVHVRKGTWLLGIRVKDPDLWTAVKSGDITGYSIGGSAIRRPEQSAQGG